MVKGIESHFLLMEVYIHGASPVKQTALAEELNEGAGRGIESSSREIVDEKLVDVAVHAKDDGNA